MIDILEAKDLEVVDNFNKFSILINIFNAMILKFKTDTHKQISPEVSKEIVCYYDKMITQYLISNKLCNNSDFSLLFVEKIDLLNYHTNHTNMVQVGVGTGWGVDVGNSLGAATIAGASSSIGFDVELHVNPDLQIKILSIFEEELRNYLKIKKISNTIKINHQANDFPNILNTLFNEIFNLIIQNFEILNDVYENFKIKEIEKEKIEIKNVDNNLNKIRNTVILIIDKITNKLTSEQNFKLLEYLRHNLTEEKEKIKLDIKNMKLKLEEYAAQGEELSNLVKEYKKICNLIECKKLSI